jgi:hypothetical protein
LMIALSVDWLTVIVAPLTEAPAEPYVTNEFTPLPQLPPTQGVGRGGAALAPPAAHQAAMPSVATADEDVLEPVPTLEGAAAALLRRLLRFEVMVFRIYPSVIAEC